jgi:death-on-curing protein
MTWRWVSTEVAYAVHDRQLAEHGGLDGIRDLSAIEAAIGRAQNLSGYGAPDAADLAAAYAYGLARNDGFADGKKRTGWVIARLFLADNGVRLGFDKTEAVRLMEGVAAGSVTETGLADWFRNHISQS